MSESGELPAGWVEKFSEQHQRKYWKNEESGKKSWKYPVEERGDEGDDVSVTSSVGTDAMEKRDILRSESGGSTESNWEEKYSAKHGKKYFLNKKTRRTSWVLPKEESSPEDEKASESHDNGNDWEEKFSEKHGKAYYVNKKTKRKSWVAPPSTVSAHVPDMNSIPESHSGEDNLSKDHPRTENNKGVNEGNVDEGDESADWEEKFSEKHGKAYYVNKKTKRKSWVAPPSTVSAHVPDMNSIPESHSGDDGPSKDYIEEHHIEQRAEEDGKGGELGSVDEGDEFADWEEKFSEKHGKAYYVNKKTKRKSWVAPPSTVSAHVPDMNSIPESQLGKNNLSKDYIEEHHIEQRAEEDDKSSNQKNVDRDASADWEEKFSEKHGKPYYVNKKTKRKSWVAPPVTVSAHMSDMKGIPNDHIERITCERIEGGELLRNSNSLSSVEGGHDPDYGKGSVTHNDINKCLEENSLDSPKLEHVNEDFTPSVQSSNILTLNNVDVGTFASDISRIEVDESPGSSPVKDIPHEEFTLESIKKFSPTDLLATLNYYIKSNEIFQHNLSVADEKCAEFKNQNNTFETDNSLLRETIHEYASQHHAREEMIQNLQAQVSLITQERDEALFSLQNEHSMQADRDVKYMIQEESESELTALTNAQKSQICSLQEENEVLIKDNEDLAEKNDTLNALCDSDSRRIVNLEENLFLSKRDCRSQGEHILQLKSKCSTVSKKISSVEKELNDLKVDYSGILEKNKSLISENSKLIRRVNMLYRKKNNAGNCSPSAKKMPSPSSRFSAEGIHIPVNMIQSSSSRSTDSLLDYSLSDINNMDVDNDERFKRRAELEAGWVFIDVDIIPLHHLTSNEENDSDVANSNYAT